MTPRSWIALIAAALLAPATARADEREWTEDYTDRSYAPDYDVSVDVGGAVGFETFERPLSSYGDWVVAGSHGRVWRPRVAAGWRPYYYGRWEWTTEGWLWVSDEPWGWAAYHYGRWAHDPYYGWVWVPGYEWAPAWVAWRTSGDVIGWAPLAPGLSVYVTAYPFVDFWWTFVPTVRFVSVPVYTVAYAPTYTRRWYHATAPSPARPAPRPAAGRPAPARVSGPAWGGPSPRLIAERTGRAPAPARIVAAPSPGARARPGEISVFRPSTVRSTPPPMGRSEGRGGERWGAPGRAVQGGAPAERGGPAWTGPARERDVAAPPRSGGRGEGRGPAAAPPAAREGRGPAAAPPAAREGRGPAAAPPAAREDRGERGGGERSGPPAWRAEPRGGGSSGPARGGGSPAPGGGNGRGDRGGDRGESRGGRR